MQLRKPAPISSYKADSDPSNSGMTMNEFPINSQTSLQPESGFWNSPMQSFPQPRSSTSYEMHSKRNMSPNTILSQNELQHINRSGYIYNNPPNQDKLAAPQPPSVNTPLADLNEVIKNPVTHAFFSSVIKHEAFVIPTYFPGALNILKQYFNVSHRYVLNRLGFLLFPFHTILKFSNYSNSFNSNSNDQLTISYGINERPETNTHFNLDFYIPLMALITYILLFGMAKGTSDEFKPDVLGNQATYSVTIIAMEVILIKVSFYLAKISYINTFDLFAFCGYKFVHLALIACAGLLLRRDKKLMPDQAENSFFRPYLIYLVIINYFMICYAIEMAFFLKSHSKSHNDSNVLTNASIKNRVRFFIGIFFGLLQFPICWSLMPPNLN